ncbi:MAG: hypothetical protein RJB26_540 [Pseudomonadota bacterium]|jgi:hypothetical protein
MQAMVSVFSASGARRALAASVLAAVGLCGFTFGAGAQTPPAAPAAPAATPTAPAATATEEKPFQIPAGWRHKTVKGEEVYCKKTAVTGSRFGTEVCMTLVQLEQHERNNAEMRDRMQQSFRLCSGGTACAAN